jgi:hypothetical protein
LRKWQWRRQKPQELLFSARWFSKAVTRAKRRAPDQVIRYELCPTALRTAVPGFFDERAARRMS